jgi:hypothetical protein
MSDVGLFPYLNIRHVHFKCNTNTSGGLCVLNRCCDSVLPIVRVCVPCRPSSKGGTGAAVSQIS